MSHTVSRNYLPRGKDDDKVDALILSSCSRPSRLLSVGAFLTFQHRFIASQHLRIKIAFGHTACPGQDLSGQSDSQSP